MHPEAQSYDLLGAIMSATTDKIAAQDTEFRYLTFNTAYRKEFKKVFGVDLAIGDSMVAALAHLPEEQKNAVELWGRALGGETFTLEHEFGDPERERNCYELHFFPIRDREGRITGAAHIVRDATSRRRVEEALREAKEGLERRIAERTEELAKSEERLRIAALAGQIGVWSWTPATTDVIVTANWRRLFGIGPDTHVTFETWREAVHAEDRERAVSELNTAVETHRDFNTEYRVVWPDGTVRWMVDRGRAFYDESGRATGMSGVNVDITERKRAALALDEHRQWLRVTLSSIGDAVLATDTAGRVTFLNPVASRLTGWLEAEALGVRVQDVFRIINEATREKADDIAGRVLREGHVVALANHTALITRDGREVPIEDSAAPIRDNAGNVAGVVLVFHDVTEQRRTEKALRESEQRVRLKLESILTPEGDIRELELGEIIDVAAIQSMLEDFYRVARLPMSILDLTASSW